MGFNKNKKENLRKEISLKREEMIKVALERGMQSEYTIRISQELDELIVEYQRLISK